MTPTNNHTSVKVLGLFVYPVKSCRGISLSEAELTPLGFKHDRQWVIVGSNGRAMTQRDNPLMSQIETRLDESHLHLSRAGHGGISIQLEAPAMASDDEIITVKVWGDECRTVLASEEASDWLTQVLESKNPVRIVRMAAGQERPQSMPEELGADTRIQFADAAPYLFVDESSLDKLNEVLQGKGESPVPINRFRCNIFMGGLGAFAEHQLSSLGNETCKFDFRIPCERCVVTTIDQESSIRHPRKEPFATLREINSLDPKRRQPLFGQYATLESGAGARIAVGDRLATD